MSPRLILINGVPASGKTTLARSWCEQRASELPLALDIDAIRSMIGGWQDSLQDAGLAAREVAIAGIGAHLQSGRDVVVPQYVQRTEFIDRLAATAQSSGARFVETALIIDAATAESRFRARAETLADTDPHGSLPTGMDVIVREFDELLASRSSVVRVPADAGALETLTAAIARADAHPPGR